MAQLQVLRVPEEIEQQQLLFSGVQPCAAPHHLTVQRAYLRRPQHRDAVHLWTIPSFRQQHAVAQYVVSSMGKVVQHLRTICAFPIYLRRTEAVALQNSAEFLRGLDQRQKHHCFPLFADLFHFAGDAFQIGVERGIQIARLVVSILDCDL